MTATAARAQATATSAGAPSHLEAEVIRLQARIAKATSSVMKPGLHAAVHWLEPYAA